MPHLPTMVEAAQTVARALDYHRGCSDCLGMFLQALAGSVVRGRLLIFGAGTGIASSWIIQSLSPYAKLIAYEPDPSLANASRPVIGEKAIVFEESPRDALRRGPFSFMFINLGRSKVMPVEVVDEVAPGGIVVVGNVRDGDNREAFEEWRQIEGFTGVEVLVEGEEPALVLTRQVV